MNHYPSIHTIAKNDDVLVAHCSTCGFAHQFPVPDAKTVAQYYNDDQFYKFHSPQDWFANEIAEHKLGLWNTRYDFELELIKKYTQWPTTIIDTGTGAGWFVQRARHLGVTCWGIEPSKTARSILNLQHVVASWDNVVINPDVIRASLVLEHLVDPIGEMKMWHKKLTRNGVILVTVPHDFSPLQARLKTKHFVSKVHINYFDSETIEVAMEKAGFKVLWKGATFPIDLFPVIGLDYRNRPKLGHTIHLARLYFEKIVGKRAFYLYKKLFDRFTIGRELVYLAKKI